MIRVLFILSAVLALTGAARAAEPPKIADAGYSVLPFGHTTFIRYEASVNGVSTTGMATGILGIPKGAKVLGTVEYPGIWVANQPVKAEPPAIAKKGCTCAVGCRCYEGKLCECLSPCPCEGTGPCAVKADAKDIKHPANSYAGLMRHVEKGGKGVLYVGVPHDGWDGGIWCVVEKLPGITPGVYDCYRNYTVNMMQIRTAPVSNCTNGKCSTGYPASFYGFANPKSPFDTPSCANGQCSGTTTVRRR